MANTSILAAFERMWQHVVAKLGDKADKEHNHDDVYYTESEVDSKLSGKANSSHTHSISNVTNLQSTLDGKAPKSHASTATTYGAGTDANYGHVKLSDSVTSTSSTNGGIAATPAAVKLAYDLANGKANASHNHSGSEITSGTVAAARLPNASASAAGIVSTGSQTLAGAKTFSGKITASSGITTGGDIVSDTANTDDVGSTSIPFANMYTKNLYINPKSVSGSIKFYGSFAATTEGTTTTDGYTELKVGNNTPTGSEGNARGLVQIYNSSSGSATLEAGHSNSSDYRIYLPSGGGTLALNSTFGKSGSTAKSGLVPAPSTTAGTTKYLREDGKWVVPPDTSVTKLWENASPTSNFNSQIISLDLSEYDFVKVMFKAQTDVDTYCIEEIKIGHGKECFMGGDITSQAINSFIVCRLTRVTTTGVNFSTGSYTFLGGDNKSVNEMKRMIPVEIYGVKGVK